VHGEGRGRGIGFPTLNVLARAADLPFGVYAVWASLLAPGAPASGEQKKYSAVMNWGGRPTFCEELPVMEVHLLDADGDFYGRTVEVEVGPLLRGVRRFAGVEELKAQIAEDIRRAREFFQTGRI